MSSSGLALVNGFPRTQTFTVSLPLIYDQSVTLVASGGNGSTTITGALSANTPITLPASGTYTLNANSVPNLDVFLNGQRLDYSFDWATSGSGPNFTAFSIGIALVVGDRLDLRIDRSS